MFLKKYSKSSGASDVKLSKEGSKKIGSAQTDDEIQKGKKKKDFFKHLYSKGWLKKK